LAHENDAGTLHLSGLNTHLMQLQPAITAAQAQGESTLYYTMYSDGTYSYFECVTHHHEPPVHGAPLEDWQVTKKRSMLVMQNVAERPYASTTILFITLQNKYTSQHLLNQECGTNDSAAKQVRAFFPLQLPCLFQWKHSIQVLWIGSSKHRMVLGIITGLGYTFT